MQDSDSRQASKLSAHLFDARELGLSLKEVATDIIKKEDKEIQSHWYHSSKDADLFIWKDHKNNIIKQQISFYGQLMEWNIIEGVRTGLVIEDETTKLNGSALIRYDGELQKQTAQQGIDIVGHVPGLNAQDKIDIISNFIKSPLFSQMSPEEILSRYGIQSKAKTKPEWLIRILNWLGLSGKN
ncbi:MAG: hypothetical protein KDD38_04705 [Bdellovibrionales bacterium]|nr:hypothetical protein [Bdellovibrionales bacterium]